MNTETMIAKLFDFQKLARNKRLDKVIAASCGDCAVAHELDDDALGGVWAAGDPEIKAYNDLKSNKNKDE